MDDARKLVLVKAVHTVAWAFFAGFIVALPVAALAGRLELAAWLAAATLVEVVILVVNGMKCPLTAVAARYTADRADNFDIYLPLWLARYNKLIFGALFVLGGLVALAVWLLGA
ncbi:MAG: hypothetical protein KC635_18425 [Myxococcales bacterium]|nr:hypothetical protein [Myxococcales bacterium]MCB9736022.1 hypothetical protein [Deltaproteobacteria bacterium]